MLTISLNQIKSKKPCSGGLDKLLAAQSTRDPDEKFSVSECLDSNSIGDVLWFFEKNLFPDHIHIVKEFALLCAERVEHLANDQLAIDCNRATRGYIKGEITIDELKASLDTTRAAANYLAAWAAADADAAAHAGWAAADAACSAADAACSAAAAAVDAAYATYAAAYASAAEATYATDAAAHAATYAAEKTEQKKILKRLLDEVAA